MYLLEIIYLIYFIYFLILDFTGYAVSTLGATVSNAKSTACDNISKTSLKKHQTVDDYKAAEKSVLNQMSPEAARLKINGADLGLGYLMVTIVMIIAYIPRVY